MKKTIRLAKKSFALLLSASMVIQSMSQYTYVFAEETTPVVESENVNITEEVVEEPIEDEEVVEEEISIMPMNEEEPEIPGTPDPQDVKASIRVSMNQTVDQMNTEFTLKVKNTTDVLSGDYFELSLPDPTIFNYEGRTGDILANTGTFIGTYEIVGGVVKVTYDADVLAGNEGELIVYASYNDENLPDKATTIPWKPTDASDSMNVQIVAKQTKIKQQNGTVYSFTNVNNSTRKDAGTVIWVDGNEELKPVSPLDFIAGIKVMGSFIGDEVIDNLVYELKAENIQINQDEGHYIFTIKDLPTKGEYNGKPGTFEWNIEKDWTKPVQSAIGYVEQSVPGSSATYLVKEKDVQYSIAIRNTDLAEDEITEILKRIDHLPAYAKVDGVNVEYSVADLFDVVYDPSTKTALITNKEGLPAYACPSGEPIPYWIDVTEMTSSKPYVVDYEGGSSNYIVGVDNKGNYSSVTYANGLYENGNLVLTIDSITSYTATKYWADASNPVNRPEVVMTLYRYTNRDGQSYKTAAPVFKDGEVVSITICSDHTSFEDDIEINNLPKYDREGYEYVYFMIENLTSSLYEQRFGNEVIGDNRDATDRSIYNGESVTNAFSGEVEVDLVKQWKATSLQSQFGNVSAQFELYKHVSTDITGENKEWVKVDDLDMGGFSHSRLMIEDHSTRPQYDDFGYEIEYEWREVSVTQNGEVFPLDENGVFSLNQRVTPFGKEQTVYYQMISEHDPNTNSTRIRNIVADKVDVNVKKKWIVPDDFDQAYPTISLKVKTNGSYSSNVNVSFDANGMAIESTGIVTLDGIQYEYEVIPTGSSAMDPSGDGGYQIQIKGLPHFDESGVSIQYQVFETQMESFDTHYDFIMDELGNLFETVTNEYVVGPGNHELVLKKEWIDNNDTTYRPAILVDVYYRNDEADYEKLNEQPIVVDAQNAWIQYFYYSLDYEPENVVAVETNIGEYSYSVSNEFLESLYQQSYNQQITTENEQGGLGANRMYDVTYARGHDEDLNRDVVTITNKRVGEVNFNFVKDWIDGDGEVRQELSDLLGNSEIGYLVIRVGGLQNEGDFVALDLTEKHNELSILGLPKYNDYGKEYTYSALEVVRTEDGFVSFEEWLNSVDASSDVRDYVSTLSQPVISNYGTDIIPDSYDYEATNTLTGKKDIQYHVEWRDDYQYDEGNRFDISLNLYIDKHVGDDVSYEKYYHSGDWVLDANYPNNDNDVYICEFKDLPKYDENGYKIHYFAIQSTPVDRKTFDYIDAIFKDETGSSIIGNEVDGPTIEDKVVDVGADKLAVAENGWILNKLSKVTQFNAVKIWEALPTLYNLHDLPNVEFDLTKYTYVKGKIVDTPGFEPKVVAQYTIESDEWETKKTQFVISQINENNPAHSSYKVDERLNRYDEEGRLLDYTLSEQILYSNGYKGNPLYITDGSDFASGNIQNTYSSDTIDIYVRKYIDVDNIDPETKKARVSFNLYRSYIKNDGTESAIEFYRQETFSVENYIEDEDGIAHYDRPFAVDKYAPNGSEYSYFVAEEPVPGYVGKFYPAYSGKKQYASKEQVTSDYIDIDGKYVKEDYKLPVEDGDHVTFYNKYDKDAKTKVAFSKRWIDNRDDSNTREPLTFEITRNSIASGSTINETCSFTIPDSLLTGDYQTVDLSSLNPTSQFDISNVTLTIESKDDYVLNRSNLIAYTLNGVDKYATNGSVFKYTVKETSTSDAYNVTNTNATLTSNPSNAVITNSYETQVSLTKSWNVKGKSAPINNSGSDITVYAELYAITDVAGDTYKLVDGSDVGMALAEYGDYNLTVRYTYPKEKPMNPQTKTIGNLPTTLQINGVAHDIKYVLVETKIVYNAGQSVNTLNPVVDGTFASNEVSITIPEYDLNTSSNLVYPSNELMVFTSTDGIKVQPTNSVSNTYDKIGVSIKKIYDEGSLTTNIWRTRGDSNNSNTNSSISFRLERSIDKETWEQVGDIQKLELKGFDNQVDLITEDLPAFTMLNGVKKLYTYRFLELDVNGNPVENSLYNKTYTVSQEVSDDSYNTVYTNTLETVSLSATKVFKDAKGNTVTENTDYIKYPVTLRLQYMKEDGSWADVYYNGNTSNVLNVTLDGSIDEKVTNYGQEDSPWHATWTDIPRVFPASKTKTVNGVEQTIYGVKEVSNNYANEVDGFDKVSKELNGSNTTTLTNTLTMLVVNKEVMDPDRSQDTDEEFTFQVTSSNANDKNTYTVQIGDSFSSITLQGANTFKLKNGQTAYIHGLAKNATYTVKEVTNKWLVDNTNGTNQFSVKLESNAEMDFVNRRTGTLTIDKTGNVYTSEKSWVANQPILNAKFSIQATMDMKLGNDVVIQKNQYVVASNGAFASASNEKVLISTNANGTFTITGLPLGTYKVVEEEAPNGYEVVDPITVVLDNTNTSHITNGVIADIENLVDPEDRYGFTITKLDEDGAPLAGAEFQIYAKEDIYQINNPSQVIYAKDAKIQKDGKDYKVTSGIDGKAAFIDLPYGSYYVREVKAPDGFVLYGTDLDDDRLFTVESNGQDVTITPIASIVKADGNAAVTVDNTEIKLDLVKVKTGSTQSIENPDYAVFTVSGKFADGMTSYTITNNKNTSYAGDQTLTLMSEMNGKWIYNETYTFTEIYAPKGYELTNPFNVFVNPNGSATIGAQNARILDNTKIYVDDDPVEIILYKHDATTQQPIGEDEDQPIFDITGVFADSLNEQTLSVEMTDIGSLNSLWIAGNTYRFTETYAPEGYELADSFSISIDTDGTIKADDTLPAYVHIDGNSLTIDDDEISVSLSKVTGDSKTPIDETEKPEFEITGIFAGESEETTVTKKSNELYDLNAMWVAGKDYIFEETEAPKGYEVAAKFIVHVEEDGSLTVSDTVKGYVTVEGSHIVLTDASLDVDLKKASEGVDLDGAIFTITGIFKDSSQEESRNFDVDNLEYELVNSLIGGNTYKIKEYKAPRGYKKNPYEISFTVSKTGVVSIEREDLGKGWSAVNDTISLDNEMISIDLLKVNDITSTESIEGNDYAVFKVEGDFANKTSPIYVSNSLNTKWTGANLYTFTDLSKEWIYSDDVEGDHVYTFTEVYAPEGYVTVDPFTVKLTHQGELVEVNDVDWVDVENNTLIVADDKMSVDLVKVDGTTPLTGAKVTVTGWFKDATDEETREITITDETELVGVLVAGKNYTVKEIVAPNGYKLNYESFVFTVNEKGVASVVTSATDYSLTNNTITLDDQGIQLELNKLGANTVLNTKDSREDSDLTAVFTIEGRFDNPNNSPITVENVTAHNFDQFDSRWLQSNDANEYIYTLTETYAPKGYAKLEPFSFKVDVDGNVIIVAGKHAVANNNSLNVSNLQTKAEISKLNENNELLDGASLQILNKDGEAVYEFVSSKEVEVVTGKLIAGETYTLHEVKAPTGYVIAADVTFDVAESLRDGQVVIATASMIDPVVEFIKVDEREMALKDAEFEIYDKDDEDKVAVDSWTTDGEVYRINNLQYGKTYIITETYTPDGYVKAEDIEITINDELFTNNEKVITVENKDDIITLQLTKVEEKDIVIDAPATYGLYSDKECKNLIESKDTVDGKLSFDVRYALLTPDYSIDGYTYYYIQEINAPTGYALSDHVYEVVIENATGTVLIDEVESRSFNAVDTPTEISFAKVDEEGKYLPASFEIKEEDNDAFKPITFSTTEEEPVVTITKQLTANHTYVLSETVAPDGYLFAEDITFTVTDDNSGKIVKIGESETDLVKVIDKVTEVNFEKMNEAGELLDGVSFEILDKDGNVVESFTTTDHPTVVSKLHLNETYTLHEVEPKDGYYRVEDIQFSLNGHTTLTVTVDGKTVDSIKVVDPETVVYINKVDEHKKALKGAELKVVDEDGKTVDSWTTDGSKHEIRCVLVAGKKYTLKEVKAPDGYVVAKDITFTVDELKPEEDVIITMVDKAKETNTSVFYNTTFYSVSLLGSLFVIFEILRKRKA